MVAHSLRIPMVMLPMLLPLLSQRWALLNSERLTKNVALSMKIGYTSMSFPVLGIKQCVWCVRSCCVQFKATPPNKTQGFWLQHVARRTEDKGCVLCGETEEASTFIYNAVICLRYCDRGKFYGGIMSCETQ